MNNEFFGSKKTIKDCKAELKEFCEKRGFSIDDYVQLENLLLDAYTEGSMVTARAANKIYGRYQPD